jgi:hypothetical protein
MMQGNGIHAGIAGEEGKSSREDLECMAFVWHRLYDKNHFYYVAGLLCFMT